MAAAAAAAAEVEEVGEVEEDEAPLRAQSEGDCEAKRHAAICELKPNPWFMEGSSGEEVAAGRKGAEPVGRRAGWWG